MNGLHDTQVHGDVRAYTVAKSQVMVQGFEAGKRAVLMCAAPVVTEGRVEPCSL